MAPLAARLIDSLAFWFAGHPTWTVLIVGVVVGTIAITLRLDRDM